MYIIILTDLEIVEGEADDRLSVSNTTMMFSDKNNLSPFFRCITYKDKSVNNSTQHFYK